MIVNLATMPKTENDDFKCWCVGYNIAVKAFADPRLKGKRYHLVFVGAPDGM